MISFWVTRNASRGLETYRATRGLPVADRFVMRLYDDIEDSVRLQRGVNIFSDLDQLSPAQRSVVARMHDALAGADPRQPPLNDPRRARLRRPLLEALHAEGKNAFNVFGARDAARVARFPVFVRCASDHDGPSTGLLHNRSDLSRALLALGMRGYPLRDLLIIEFCDTSDRDGVFRKYAAFRVGSTLR